MVTEASDANDSEMEPRENLLPKDVSNGGREYLR